MHTGKRKAGCPASPVLEMARTGSLAEDEHRDRIPSGGPRCGVAEPRSPREQLPEAGVLADRIEVGIAFKEGAGALREFDRALKVRDGLVLLAGEAFAAGDL
jgi:hypothetical protein